MARVSCSSPKATITRVTRRGGATGSSTSTPTRGDASTSGDSALVRTGDGTAIALVRGMCPRVLALVLLTGACKRSDASDTATTTASASPSASVAVAPIVSASSAPSAATSSALPPLDLTAPPPQRAAAKDPLRACCEALRKQSQLAAGQAADVCDGVVAAFDGTGDAPKLEQLLAPVLQDVPLPKACKGL